MQENRVKSIRKCGQSIWLDFIDRKIMGSGELHKMIDINGISGVTSNPSIFEKAIANRLDYQEDINILAHKNNEKIFFELALKDIKRAAGFLNTIYERENGEDGYVSLEVSPRLAYDTEGTIKQAKELWEAAGCRNVMIKIPATKEGLPAIRECISEGINVNITLLFGLPRYEKVIEAYLSGLENRIKTNQPINQIFSVASFFVSRIDVLTDPLLEDRGYQNLKGEVAISSAKKAYDIFKNVFATERFNLLAKKGAKKQKLLWASTTTKDPTYSQVKYVEPLIGPETINTLTFETINAFNSIGEPESALDQGLEKANAVLEALNAHGIDINIITQKLEDQGIEKFNKAYLNLLKTIEKQKQKQDA